VITCTCGRKLDVPREVVCPSCGRTPADLLREAQGRPDALELLPCGCRVEARDDGMHIWPCSAGHLAAHDQAVAESMRPIGIPVVFES
jgi:hypothetical protein